MLSLYHSRWGVRVSRGAAFRGRPPGHPTRAPPRSKGGEVGAQHVGDDGIETADGGKRIGEDGLDTGASINVGAPAGGPFGDGLLKARDGGTEIVVESSRQPVGDEHRRKSV